MHETELSQAEQLAHWSDTEATASFIMGEIDESDIPRLEQHGLIIQRLCGDDEAQVAKGFGLESMSQEKASLPSIKNVFAEGAGFLKKNLQSAEMGWRTRDSYYRLRMLGPLLQKRKDDLKDLDVHVIELLPDKSLLVRIPAGKTPGVSSLPWVNGIAEDPGPEMAAPKIEMARARSGSVSGNGTLSFDLILREAAALPSVQAWLIKRHVQIVGTGRSKIRIVLPEDSSLQSQIRALPELEELEPWIPPQLHNDRARVLMRLDHSADAAVIPFPLEGQTEIIAVADTGLDDTHLDFQGRIHTLQALGRPGITNDPKGHGTHVTGSVLGDGAASQGLHKGVAPKARVFFQSLLDPKGGLGGLPVDLNNLFDSAYQAGARVHNNSWGSLAQGSYRASSKEVDEFVHDHRDMVIVFSAGNDGKASDPVPPDTRTAQPGFVNWKSIGAPASAKNCITVGASRSDRTTGGYSTLTYGVAWQADFPTPPISNELVSGAPESLAAFSSRGPTDDYRIKPDLTAPGTDIVSCKSSLAPLGEFWGPLPPHQYAYDGGTSMAAPLVTGCAALVREYYTSTQNHLPSAALVKATLINGTRWLSGSDAMADCGTQPNYHQGFGGLDMSSTIPVSVTPDPPRFELHFVDTWQDPARHFTFTGQRHRYQFTLDVQAELRICLVYTDLPARALQNNLNLFLQRLPSPTDKWRGNQQLPFSLGGPDTTNNVEIIRLPTAAPGEYLVQITSQNLLSTNPAQDYALVITTTGTLSNWTVMD